MLTISDAVNLISLYGSVNADDWTWLPLLYMAFLHRTTPIFLGYVVASASLYWACFALATASSETSIYSYINDDRLHMLVGAIFIAIGLYRGIGLFKSAVDETEVSDGPERKDRYPLFVAVGAVFANGYNNVLVLTPAFASLEHGKDYFYAVVLPCFNFAFAGLLLLAMHVSRQATLHFANRYARPLGAIAMLVLGVKIMVQ